MKMPGLTYQNRTTGRQRGQPPGELRTGRRPGDAFDSPFGFRYYRGRYWRRGFTTGAGAAAAAKAAAMLWTGQPCPDEVSVANPQGERLVIPVAAGKARRGRAWAYVVKDAGDDPDVTHGVKIIAIIEEAAGEQVTIVGGTGVGRVTRPGLPVPVGEAAINPVPREMITRTVREVVPAGGVMVTVALPEGKHLARRTMNPQLGITGGLSILGTTGIVEPMSEEAYCQSLVPQIDMALAGGNSLLVLTPGRKSQQVATCRYGFPAPAVVQAGNFFGFMLEEAAGRGVERFILLGEPGKLVKLAAGIFNTHNRVADARRETLAAHAALLGAPAPVVAGIMAAASVGQAVDCLDQAGLKAPVLERVAVAAGEKVRGFLHRFTPGPERDWEIGVIITGPDGQMLACTPPARELGGTLGCRPECW